MEIKDRILVVEDDKRISSFFKTVLESNRYDVIMASTERPGVVLHAGDRGFRQDP